MSTKNKRSSSVQVEYLIHVMDIKPWPPSQSLKSVKSVVMHWENGEKNAGHTNTVAPAVDGGRIEFNEFFKLGLIMHRDTSARTKDGEAFKKNLLEFNLHEPRRDKTQLLATAVVDLSEGGVLKNAVDVNAPMSSKRSLTNTCQPVLHIKIQPIHSKNTGSLSKRMSLDCSRSVSSLMSEEYAGEAESFSLTDDDVSSLSSLANGESKVIQSKGEDAAVPPPQNGGISCCPSVDFPLDPSSLSSESIASQAKQEFLAEDEESYKGESAGGEYFQEGGSLAVSEVLLNDMNGCSDDSKGIKNYDFAISEEPQMNTKYVDKLKHMKSVRSSTEMISTGLSSMSKAEYGSAENNAMIKSKSFAAYDIMDSKIQRLENRIRILESELTEAAAIEAALYSVPAQHTSSFGKVHTPARRLSRLYINACANNSRLRRNGVAKSCVSGLVLVAKACGNDVPRLTFWLSNAAVLRTMVSLECKSNAAYRGMNEYEKEKKLPSPLKWKTKSLNQYAEWENPNTFVSSLEKVEAWIFCRIVESIWWQALAPHMQSTAEITDNRSAGNHDQSFAIDNWRSAFTEACLRLCPVRAGGSECGCLHVQMRMIMKQCLARLDVAMFNAILRDSSEDASTDPLSDPISNPEVLPIPPGMSSFGAGAQLKTAIGNWSRWLTDMFGIDEDDSFNTHNQEEDDRNSESTFKSFHLLNQLSDLMMLPKDMLLNKSIRDEVCPTFGASLIWRILDMFTMDEFCSDPVPQPVFDSLVSEDPEEEGVISSVPFVAPSPTYLPPFEEIISKCSGRPQLQRNGSSLLRKANTSDDELDEVESPLDTILQEGSSRLSPIAWRSKPPWNQKINTNCSSIRYQRLRDVWMNCE